MLKHEITCTGVKKYLAYNFYFSIEKQNNLWHILGDYI